jgi:hypothetical protein
LFLSSSLIGIAYTVGKKVSRFNEETDKSVDIVCSSTRVHSASKDIVAFSRVLSMPIAQFEGGSVDLQAEFLQLPRWQLQLGIRRALRWSPTPPASVVHLERFE